MGTSCIHCCNHCSHCHMDIVTTSDAFEVWTTVTQVDIQVQCMLHW